MGYSAASIDRTPKILASDHITRFRKTYWANSKQQKYLTVSINNRAHPSALSFTLQDQQDVPHFTEIPGCCCMHHGPQCLRAVQVPAGKEEAGKEPKPCRRIRNRRTTRPVQQHSWNTGKHVVLYESMSVGFWVLVLICLLQECNKEIWGESEKNQIAGQNAVWQTGKYGSAFFLELSVHQGILMVERQ